MDDLDADLFGSLLQKPKGTAAAGQRGRNQLSEKPKANLADDDDDDPLAGLLSDDDDGGVRHHHQRSTGTIKSPDSPVNRRRTAKNVLDDLLAGDDNAEGSAITSTKKEFVLGDQYRLQSGPANTRNSRPSAAEADGNFSAAPDDMNSLTTDPFGSYRPSSSGGGGRQRNLPVPNESTRRPATTSTGKSSEDDFLGVGLQQGQATARTPSSRQGRRGISPTVVEQPPTDGGVGSSRNKLGSGDWLELKDEESELRRPLTSELDLKSKPPSPPAAAAVQRRRRNESPSFDRLDSGNDVGKPVEEPKATSTTAFPAVKNDNFLEWLGTSSKPKENLEIKKTTAALPSSSAAPSNPDPQKSALNNPGGNLSAVHLEYETRLATLRTQMAETHTKLSEETLLASANLLDLQTKARRLEFERDQLQKALDGLENRHREELDALESSFKKRTQLIEDSYQRREKRLQEEVESLVTAQSDKEQFWEKERSDLVSRWQRRLEEATQERVEDLERMKELHHGVLSTMKKDHDVAIARLQHIKKIEVDALSEAQSHSKTLQLVIEQLRTNTNELSQLQMRVEGGRIGGLEERELLLESRDRQLSGLQEQLQRQREENEKERGTLRQLVTRLEERLQQQTLGVEEEKWKMNQERNRLELDQKTLEESKRQSREQLEREKQQLQRAKEAFLDEQKAIMQQVYDEKRRTMTAAGFVEAVPSTSGPRMGDSFFDLRHRAEVESALKSLGEEKRKLEARKDHLDVENDRLDEERRSLERRCRELEEEKSSMAALAVQVKQRSEEVEEMCLVRLIILMEEESAVQTREEGFSYLQEANRVKAELEKRQEALRGQLEALKTKERSLAEERLKVAAERKQLAHLGSKLFCVACQAPMMKATTSESGGGGDYVTSSSSMMMNSKNPNWVSLWQVAADKDKEFLERETAFLQNLLRSTPAS